MVSWSYRTAALASHCDRVFQGAVVCWMLLLSNHLYGLSVLDFWHRTCYAGSSNTLISATERWRSMPDLTDAQFQTILDALSDNQVGLVLDKGLHRMLETERQLVVWLNQSEVTAPYKLNRTAMMIYQDNSPGKVLIRSIEPKDSLRGLRADLVINLTGLDDTEIRQFVRAPV